MRRGAASSGYRNMRQRSEVVQREALAMKIRGQLTVGDAGTNGYGRRACVQLNYLVHGLQGQQIVCAICYVVEAVPRTEYFQAAFSFDVIANLLKRTCRVQAFSPVYEIARPIRKPFACSPGKYR